MPIGNMLHISPTNLLLLAAKREPYKKPLSKWKILKKFLEKNPGEWASRQNENKTERVIWSWQKDKRGDSKVESNDSPEIPDPKTSDIPGLQNVLCLWEMSVSIQLY